MENKADKINFLENHSNVFNIYVYFPLGSIYEPSKKRGMSHLMEHMMMKRSKHYTTNKMYETITYLGGNANAGTTKDLVYFYIKTTIPNYKLAADIIHDLVYNTYFDKTNLEMEKKVVLEEYNQREDDHESMIDEIATSSVLSDKNPYAKTVRGYRQDIKSVTTSDMNAYVKSVRDKYILVVSCDKKILPECKSYIHKLFGKNESLNFFDKTMAKNVERNTTPINVIVKSSEIKLSQYTTYLTFISYPNYKVKQNIILSLVKFILTSAGFNSILFSKLREERGLVYYINSFNEDYRYIGLYKITFATSNPNIVYIISLVFSTLLEFIKEGLTDKRLLYFKKSYLNKIEYMFSDQSFKDSWHGDNLFYQTGMTQKQIIEYISSCTNDDIKKVAKEVLSSDNIGIVTYGSYKQTTTLVNNMKEIVSTYMALLK